MTGRFRKIVLFFLLLVGACVQKAQKNPYDPLGENPPVPSPSPTASATPVIPGSDWVLVTASAGWSPRDVSNGAAVFNGKMWVIGGIRGPATSDVWSSPDGAVWTEETATAAFPGRDRHACAVFNGKLWVLGGFYSGGLAGSHNDIWSSPDGVNWTLETPAAAFPERAAHSAVALNGKLYVLGGFENIFGYNDVWSSADGVTWIEETAAAPFDPRYAQGCAAYNGELWVLSGAGAPGSDVWHSPDGANWTLATLGAAFTPRDFFGCLVFANRLWVIGGYDSGFQHDVFSSSDGVGWTRATAAAAFPKRQGLGALSFGASMWVLGGSAPSTAYADVWKSS